MTEENKLGITDIEKLHLAEERLEKIRARELYDMGILTALEPGTYRSLAAIHSYMFGDVYQCAGQKRTVDICKGMRRFTPIEGLEVGINFADIMPCDTFDDIIDKYIEMNIVHPFRVGNERAMRLWLNSMLQKKLGRVVDWSTINKDALDEALKRCTTEDAMLYSLLKGALTVDIGREAYLRGVDASFAFEGYSAYKTAEL